MRPLSFIIILLTVTTAKAQSVQLQEKLFNEALKQQKTKQIIDLGETFYRLAVQNNDGFNADYYANHVADAYCRMGTSHFKAGYYTLGITPALAGLLWLSRSQSEVDTIRFQLSSLVAACYGRIPLADSATYWYAQTNGYLSAHPQLRKSIPADICGYYLSHAYFLSRTGDSRRAFDYLQIASSLAKKTGNQRLLAITYNYTGNYFFQIRQFDQADVYYRKALLGYEAGTVDQCWGYVILGNNDRVAGRPAAGLAHLQNGQYQYQKRIAQHPHEQHIDFEIQLAYYMAECQRALGRWHSATNAYQACLTLHEQHYRPRGEFIAYSWLGLSRIKQGQAKRRQALALASRGIQSSCYRHNVTESPADYLGTVVNEKTLYESLKLQADLWYEEWLDRHTQHALLNAVNRYDQALTIAARLRRNLIPAESKFFLNSAVAPCVEQVMDCGFELFRQTGQQTYKNRLFALMERHRMMTISDVLHEKYRMALTIPAPLARREQTLRSQKTMLEKAVVDEPAGNLKDSLREQLNRINILSYSFLDSLEGNYPRYFSLKYDTRPLSIGQVQKRLPKGVGYLTYYVGNRYLIGCLVKPSGSLLVRVPLPNHFADTVNQLWQSLRQPPGMFSYTGQPQAVELYDLLIRPIADSLQTVQRLIISRDGPLHYVPFDLLQTSVGVTNYFGEQVAISYGYSAELTFNDAPKRVSGRSRVAGFAPYSRSKKANNADSAYTLNWSLAEIQAWKGAVFEQRKATKETFLRVAPTYDIVVLATHAVADEAHPERSYIGFHPVGQDSLLQATEIANLSLDSLKLLVLNACEGNSGVLQTGEGPLSLARVFRLAGCRAILTTSWKASDESTAAFNALFQQYVAQGLPTDLALQKTRQDFRTDKRFAKWRHPFHWANVALIGAPTTIYAKPTLPAEAMGTIGLLVVLVFMGWFIQRPLSRAKPR